VLILVCGGGILFAAYTFICPKKKDGFAELEGGEMASGSSDEKKKRNQ
jgi:hypothetical protein